MTKQNESIAETLKQAWQELRADHPHMRIRDAAATLGVSEAELLATDCGNRIMRLRENWPTLLSATGALGPVMALTRNHVAVHEKTGLYDNVRCYGDTALISGHNIELYLSTNLWQFGFAATEDTRLGPRHSLQFFGVDGEAIHKIYLTEQSDFGLYRRLVDTFRADGQAPSLELQPFQTGPVHIAPARRQDVPENWRRLLLCSGHADSEPTVQVIGRIAAPVFHELMAQLTLLMLPIQILVGNRAAIQLHDGPIQNLRINGPWFNVLDQGFNLHLNETAVAGVDIVNIAYRQHRLTGLLLRDQGQRTVASLFGNYDQTDGESAVWRNLMSALSITTYV
ncbi:MULTISPECIES: ChuX/HutX family heme-like substrate-binding protein [Methylomonas]|nr:MULTISPECIES: ChuX/HutX family heme-like substrate-binding protein [Methylomonas]